MTNYKTNSKDKNEDLYDEVTQRIEKMIKKEKKNKEKYEDEEFNELYRMLLNSADNTLLFRIYSQLIAIFMSLRVMNKVDKMKKDEKKGKRHYTWEEYDEVYDQMPVFIEYEEEEYDEDGYWDLNL